MDLLEGALKAVGSAGLLAVGAASGLMRTAATAVGNDALADLVGGIQDTSLEAVHDMWTPDEEKDDAYYDKQAERMERRAEDSVRSANSWNRRVEEERKKLEKK